MCLSVATSRPEAVLGEGYHKGYKWAVVHNQMGMRCGYIRVPKGHPWHGKHYDDIKADCHGGLTFADPDVEVGKEDVNDKGGYWVGFDCAHCDDAADPELLDKLKEPERTVYKSMVTFRPSERNIVRTQEYVEGECRSLIDQAITAWEGALHGED